MEIEDVIAYIYPSTILQNPRDCLKRSILAPTNHQVDIYNDIILTHVQGDQHIYMATDSLKEVNAAGLVSPASALDFAAKQTPPGLPSHTLTIKTNRVYRLLQNFSLDRGLVKNVRVIVTNLETNSSLYAWYVTETENQIRTEKNYSSLASLSPTPFTQDILSYDINIHWHRDMQPCLIAAKDSIWMLLVQISCIPCFLMVNFIQPFPESVTIQMPSYDYAQVKLLL